jgi:tRNA A-37 threonylcarbamoyl transferase component Bud32/anti-sigma factor RsiW
MGPNQVAHPSSDQLAAFASGQAPEESAVELSEHLAACPACRTVVDALSNDTLLSLLRQGATAKRAEDLHEGATTAGPPAMVPVAGMVPPALAAHERYSVLELLGAGGMGAVYKAEHRRMERHVALKVINPTLMDRPAMVERFHREVKAAAQLAHPNIVTAYDADQAGDTHFLVMEFVEGTSLAEKVQRDGPLPVAQACAYVRQAALGLQHAFERGMVHRDIKPHNLMLTPSGQVKVLDFGLARFVRETTSEASDASGQAGKAPRGVLTETGSLMGTADYIAPEQVSDPSGADIRADIYSLGCTLYYLLAGHAPFPEGTALDKLTAHCEQVPRPLTSLRHDVPPALRRALERMMAKSANQRYQTPAEVALALAPFAAPPRRLLRRLLLATAAGLLAVLAGTVIHVLTDNGEFVLETADDSIAVMVNQKGVKVRDTATNRAYQLTVGKHRLPSGEYEINVSELPDGLEVTTPTFTLKRGGKVTAVARFQGQEEKSFLQEEGLRWFPADATFFGARDMRVFPELSAQQLLVLIDAVARVVPQDRDKILTFLTLAGRIDRVSFAYHADRLPERSRLVIRASGTINHQRLAEWLCDEFPGAILAKETGPRGEPITLIASPQKEPAFGLIGGTDLVLAGYFGAPSKSMELLRQVLDLRAGRGEPLPGKHVLALQDVPANAWIFIEGTPPEEMKRLPLFPVLPRSLVLAVRGTRKFEVSLRGQFASSDDARAFAANLDDLRRLATQFFDAISGNAQASALLVKVLQGLHVEVEADRVGAGIQAPTEAFVALEEVVRDLPLSQFRKVMNFFGPAPAKAGGKPD